MSDIVSDLQSFNEEKLNSEPYTCEEIAKAAADEITRLREENARLREALQPFAYIAEHVGEEDARWAVPSAHLRAAAAAIREGGE